MSMMYHRLGKKKYPTYDKPRDFLKAVVGYFSWCDDNPLLEEQIFQYKGAIVRADRSKVRPYSKKGLATYLNLPMSRLDSYKARGEDWAEAVEMIEQAIYAQKFDHAAAGLLNAGFIARDLGLAEKQEVSSAVTVNIEGEDARL